MYEKESSEEKMRLSMAAVAEMLGSEVVEFA